MDGRSRIPWPVGRLIDLVERRPDMLEGQIQLIVRGVQVVEDGLDGRFGLDVIPDGEEEPVRDVDEDGHLVKVVPDG